MKPTLKASVAERLKLKYDDPLSHFAFNFNLRRYLVVQPDGYDYDPGYECTGEGRAVQVDPRLTPG